MGYYFEFSQMTLEQIVLDRIGSNKFIPELDLVNILLGMVDVLAFMQENHIAHGNCHPNSIYFDMDQSCFKLYDQELLTGRSSSFTQSLDCHTKSFYLSPELILAMREERYDLSNETIWKSDVFALGMTLLEATCLHRGADCYDNSYSILAPIILERMIFVQSNYSAFFYSILKSMLSYN